jgi:hypothetical protein
VYVGLGKGFAFVFAFAFGIVFVFGIGFGFLFEIGNEFCFGFGFGFSRMQTYSSHCYLLSVIQSYVACCQFDYLWWSKWRKLSGRCLVFQFEK